MATQKVPTLDGAGKVRDKHLPTRLSDTALAAAISGAVAGKSDKAPVDALQALVGTGRLSPTSIDATVTAKVSASPTVTDAAAAAVAGAVSAGAYKAAAVENTRQSLSLPLTSNEFVNPSADGAANLGPDLNCVCSISTDAFAGWPSRGTKSFKIANSASGGYRTRFSHANRPAAGVGQQWAMGATIYNAAASARTFHIEVTYYDTFGSAAGNSLAVRVGNSVVIPAGQNSRLFGWGTAPANTASVTGMVTSEGSGGATTGDVFYIDEIDFYQGNTPRPFFYGGLPTSYWEGTENASRSLGLSPIKVNEGALSFTDPRVGGVADATATTGTNNTPALNTAFAMLASSGGGLFIPKGPYGFTTQPNDVPAGVWLHGEGYDYSTQSPITNRPKRGSVLRALAPMTHLIRLGTSVGLGDGSTGAAVHSLVIDGNNQAQSALRVSGARNKVNKTQIYSGTQRAVWLEGQNTLFQDSIAAQDDTGDVILVQGSSCYDNKIWTSQVRSPGPTGAGIRIIDAPQTDIQMNHLWAGGGGVPKPAEALVVLRAESAIYGTLIEGNTIEGVIGDEIKMSSALSAVIAGVSIVSNRFYMNSNPQDDLYSVIKLAEGQYSTFTVTGNIVVGSTATNRYKSLIDNVAAASAGGFVVTGNSLRFVRNLITGGTLPSRPSMLGNQLHDGGSWKRTNNGDVAIFTGDGTTKDFTISHGLVASPAEAGIVAGSPAAAAPNYVTWDASNLTASFLTAPAAGATIRLNWSARV